MFNHERETPRGSSNDIRVVLADDHQLFRQGLKALLELERGMCKWPVGHPGEPGLFFCGGNANGSYCASHFIRSISSR